MIAKLRCLCRSLRLSRPTPGLVAAVCCLLVVLSYHISEYWNSLRSYYSGNPINFMQEECELCTDAEEDVNDTSFIADNLIKRKLYDEDIPLYRQYTGHEPWPKVQLNLTAPGMVPTIVHYLWCHHRHLGFQHYLALLSAVRLFQPLKLILHYRRLPPIDKYMYNSWIIELQQSVSCVVFRPLPPDTPACHSPDILSTALGFLQENGGIFLGSNVIVSRLTPDFPGLPFWFAFPASDPARNESGGERGRAASEGERKEEGLDVFNFTNATNEERVTFRYSSGLEPYQGVVVIRSGFSKDQKGEYLRQIQLASNLSASSSSSSSFSDSSSSSGRCQTWEEYDLSPPAAEESAPCLHFPDRPNLYPVDIMYVDTASAQLARWLFYGTRHPMHPQTKVGDPIPRITHLIWFTPVQSSQNATVLNYLKFCQFLTILGALYVGGFHHVYIHGNAGLKGRWWEDLAKENVTFIYLDHPEVVFHQKVELLSHMSDVLRYGILHKYGGAYQDFQAMWTQRVPDWLLQYPCVASSDWGTKGDFPDIISPGVLLAKRGAPWLRYCLAAYRHHAQNVLPWRNAMLMCYRTFERHPDQLFHYPHLQVMCCNGICHPSWDPGYTREIGDKRPTMPFDWRTETLAVHVTAAPDPEASFVDPASLRRGQDMLAEIGRNILVKSGRQHLLKKDEVDDETLAVT